jgi:hypothetical protein
MRGRLEPPFGVPRRQKMTVEIDDDSPHRRARERFAKIKADAIPIGRLGTGGRERGSE